MADTQFDMTEMEQIRARAMQLKRDYSRRNDQNDDMEDLILMRDDDEARIKRQDASAKYTVSPDARNAFIGALRLLIAADPLFSVPEEKNLPEVMDQADAIELAASRLWQAGGRARQNPTHYDVVLSILGYAEGVIAVTKTSEMVEQSKGGSSVGEAKAEELAELTPYVFDVWHPNTCYPEFGDTGMTFFYREVDKLSGSVMDEFGDAAKMALGDIGRYSDVTLCQAWDYENRHVWIKDQDPPLLQEVHGLPFIPVVDQLGEGSQLFSNYEDQRWPFLYTTLKSGLWERQNLALTVLYTIMFAIGSNPMFVYTANEPGKQLDFGWDKIGGVAQIDQGERLEALVKQVIDPSIMVGLEIAERKLSESTIFGQTIGEPLGGNAPFSMVALLHQAGRLPLVVPQRKASWAIADAVKMAFKWMKAEPEGQSYENIFGELKGADIPKVFELEAKLDIALPQDQLQQANVATMLSSGDKPLVSQSHAREEYLNIGQPQTMVEEIWTERAADMKDARYNEQQIMADEAQKQGLEEVLAVFAQMPPEMIPQILQGIIQQMQGPPPGEEGQQGPPQQGPPGQPPGPPMQGPPGQGLPPEQFQGGGQPPLPPQGQPEGAPILPPTQASPTEV